MRIECNGIQDKQHLVLRSKTRNVSVAPSFESLLQNMRCNNLGIPKTSLQADFFIALHAVRSETSQAGCVGN
jgi:hypothetical protein